MLDGVIGGHNRSFAGRSETLEPTAIGMWHGHLRGLFRWQGRTERMVISGDLFKGRSFDAGKRRVFRHLRGLGDPARMTIRPLALLNKFCPIPEE